MDTSDNNSGGIGMASPYDHIDIDWIERRLNNTATVRRSRLSAYFEGVMEFVEQPPTLSRSPTPEPTMRPTGTQYTIPRSSLERSQRTNNQTIARLPKRRSTNDSDSDMSDIHRRERRQVKPIQRRQVAHFRTSRLPKPKQVFRVPTRKSAKQSSAHEMETRSKTRRIVRSWHAGSGISKARSPGRKVS